MEEHVLSWPLSLAAHRTLHAVDDGDAPAAGDDDEAAAAAAGDEEPAAHPPSASWSHAGQNTFALFPQ